MFDECWITLDMGVFSHSYVNVVVVTHFHILKFDQSMYLRIFHKHVVDMVNQRK